MMTAQSLTPDAGTASRAASNDGFNWLMPAAETAALASGNWPLTANPAPSEWTCLPKVAIRTPGLDPRAIQSARNFTVATLRRWGAADRSGDVAIVVSELLTNALRHALTEHALTETSCARLREPSQARPRGAIRLGLLQPGPCVLCVIADPCRRPPVLKEPDSHAETGRGLRVVDALSDNWGYTALGELGKAVWAMFSTTPQPR